VSPVGGPDIRPNTKSGTGLLVKHIQTLGGLVRIYLLTGEPEQALDQLEPLLHIPFCLSPEWLRIDPAFEAVRNHPQLERLLAGTG
jgi:hypothetical protein